MSPFYDAIQIIVIIPLVIATCDNSALLIFNYISQ
jgi:hypothetical protein